MVLLARRSAILLLALSVGCVTDEGGTLDLRISAVDGPVEGTYSVDWDGDVTWTREVGCTIEEGFRGSSYAVQANDRSQGELRVGLFVQSYDGPGTYERDEFQPTAALSIDWTDADTAADWHIGSDSGGRCSITIDEGSRSGVFSCVDVAVFVDELRTGDLASVETSWTCGEVERSDFFYDWD